MLRFFHLLYSSGWKVNQIGSFQRSTVLACNFLFCRRFPISTTSNACFGCKMISPSKMYGAVLRVEAVAFTLLLFFFCNANYQTAINFFVSQAVFSSIEYFLKMNAQKIRFLNAYSVKLLFHFFFKFGKKSHDSEFGIQRLAIVDLERVKGLKKQNGGL